MSDQIHPAVVGSQPPPQLTDQEANDRRPQDFERTTEETDHRERPTDDAGKAQMAADEAQAKADEARADAEAKVAQAAAESQERADEAEASRPRWQTIAAGPMDHTEVLQLPHGHLIRSAWRKLLGQGANPTDGSSVVFVEGDAPAVPNPHVMVLTPADVQPGVAPETATLNDVHPIRQVATTPEVLLALPDKKVRVLKSRDHATVGTVRAVTPADGVVE